MKFFARVILAFGVAATAFGGIGAGLTTNLLSTALQPGGFALVSTGQAATFVTDPADWPGVLRTAGDLQKDIARVTGIQPAQCTDGKVAGKLAVIIGTVGKSRWIDGLIQERKIDVAAIAGKWESFLITTVSNPIPGVAQALVIAGSDKRGTIFGSYELSEQIGVSPWYWWADVPVAPRSELFIMPGSFVQGPPAVKYRGIFINDEEPGFGQWARGKFGGINSKMYTNVFELILRLRGNYLWPAMWGRAFNEDDPLNPQLADEYGIVMGTSHHEPMLRAQAEWTKHRRDFGSGMWNYATNEDGLKRFWAEGIERNKKFESLVTIGMRGDGDEPMARDGDEPANIQLMERIVADQRAILARVVNPDPTKIPQLWALYKEVADYYEHGLRVPDDVTLLWCDDNWGNIRRLPTPAERQRSGGAGIYYHFDYVGSPRSYKWLNCNPLPKVWEQMSMAYDYGADRVWIVNVGDLKPMELPIEFFLSLAWNPKALPQEKIGNFVRAWAAREFGTTHAEAIADIVTKYPKYNAWRKPELLDANTFSLVNYQEAERVLSAWQTLVARAEQVYAELPASQRDAFFQLVLYPTKASATVAELHIETGRNRLYAKQGRVSANQHAERVRELFQTDQSLTDEYHRVAGGKWRHMMRQTRIGYTSWQDPKTNIMPQLATITPVAAASIGVAIEGAESAWPGGGPVARLPEFDEINRQTRWIDVFKRGGDEVKFSASADQPWVQLNPASGSLNGDQRILVSVDWNKVPQGSQSAVVTIAQIGGGTIPVQLTAVSSAQFTKSTVKAFGGLTGPIVIPADRPAQMIAAGNVRWERIPDYGRASGGMGVFPTTAASVTPPAPAPVLEYPVLIAKPGEYRVDIFTGISLNVQPDRGVRVAVAIDDEAPQVLDAFAGQTYDNPSRRGDPSAPAIREWSKWVTENSRILSTSRKFAAAGVHTLKVRMVDPGIILEKLVLYEGRLPSSYFGPVVD